jgi:hypothetical protein
MSASWKTAVLSIALLMPPAMAAAEPITFDFAGNVTFMNPLLSGTFDTTQSLSGFYTFESTTPDLFPANATTGFYFATDFSVTLGSYTVTSAEAEAAGFVSPVGIRVNNNQPTQILSGGVCCAVVPIDQYRVEATFNGSVGGVDGSPLQSFLLRLSDFTNLNGITSDALPPTPPDLSAFVPINRFWEFVFQGGPTGVLTIGGQITSLTLRDPVTPVPEPGTMLLLGSGLLGVARYARRRTLPPPIR